jgi:LysM repeat protein
MYHGANQPSPLPTFAYTKTPFDEEYNPRAYAGATNPFSEPQAPRPNIITHRVKDGDTLVSLSLTYGVPAPAIRKANGLTSDDIYYLPEVKIPNPKNTVYPEPPDPERDLKNNQSTVRQAFKNRTGEQDPKIIEKYLSRAAYNFYDAVGCYEREIHELRKRKEAVASLKLKFEKDDRDDKIAEYYLESHGWNQAAALKAYKEDLQQEKVGQHPMPGFHGYQPVPQFPGVVYPQNPGMGYPQNSIHTFSNPNYSTLTQPPQNYAYHSKKHD